MERKRNSILAALLSLVLPGLGQLYNAQPKKAGVVYLLVLAAFPVVSLTPMAFYFYGLAMLVLIGVVILVFIVVDAAKSARRLGVITLQKYNRWYVYLCIFLAHAFVILPVLEVAFPRPVKAYRIASGAMEPSLQVGDHIIVDLTRYATDIPQRGDVVVFIFPEDRSKDFIKRVIGLPGERIEIRSKRVFIDGRELSDAWGIHVDQTVLDARDNFGPLSVPPEQYYVMGDNRDRSYDSRFWGFVDHSLIKGKALYFYWAKDKGKIGTAIH